jgi:DNA-binding Lrp family transcriptional regulator
MSVKVLTHVFEHSRASGNDRVVALVLADHASDDGTGAYPSQALIARKANCAERTVRDCLDRLEEMGEITRRGVHPSHKTVMFDVTVTPADSATGKSRRPRQRSATKPSTERDPEIPSVLSPLVATLNRVVEGKRAKPIKLAAFLRICERFADRDLALEAEKFEHYYLHGAGENRKRKDVLAAWRNWLDSAPSALASRRGGREHPADRRIRDALDQAGVAA